MLISEKILGRLLIPDGVTCICEFLEEFTQF